MLVTISLVNTGYLATYNYFLSTADAYVPEKTSGLTAYSWSIGPASICEIMLFIARSSFSIKLPRFCG